jgi:hypothetical protein
MLQLSNYIILEFKYMGSPGPEVIDGWLSALQLGICAHHEFTGADPYGDAGIDDIMPELPAEPPRSVSRQNQAATLGLEVLNLSMQLDPLQPSEPINQGATTGATHDNQNGFAVGRTRFASNVRVRSLIPGFVFNGQPSRSVVPSWN